MRAAVAWFYVLLALIHLAQGVAAGLFGYVPADSAVATAAFTGAAAAFFVWAKEMAS